MVRIFPPQLISLQILPNGYPSSIWVYKEWLTFIDYARRIQCNNIHVLDLWSCKLIFFGKLSLLGRPVDCTHFMYWVCGTLDSNLWCIIYCKLLANTLLQLSRLKDDGIHHGCCHSKHSVLVTESTCSACVWQIERAQSKPKISQSEHGLRKTAFQLRCAINISDIQTLVRSKFLNPKLQLPVGLSIEPP